MTLPAPAPTLADDIESALYAVSIQLEAGDVVAAAAAAQALVAACQAAKGEALTPEQVERLRDLLEGCTILASTTEGELNIAMQQFGVGGRARKAYGDI